ncbi:MAG: OmpA family protein [Bacteroidales bacterium]|nr:OmpA family protein [Bacteroidales bacterium]
MKKLILFALLLCSALPFTAQNVDNKWALDFQLGKNEYYGDLDNQIFKFNHDPYMFGGVGINRYLSKSFDLGLYSTYGRWAGWNSQAHFTGQLLDLSMLFKFKFDNDFILKENAKLSPFLVGGLGYGYFSKFEPAGMKGGNAIMPIGLGLKLKLTKTISLQYQALYNLNFTDVRDYPIKNTSTSKPQKYIDGKNDNFLKQSISISFAFGKPKDTDKDGVIDRLDLCPGTPAGVSVTIGGCPVDSDGDGVADYLDKCPNTPVDVKVTSTGCPVDTDGDGVVDYMDKCPNEKGLANLGGCPDSDKDGIADKDDACPNTPANVKVDKKGCPIDTDGDGIADYLDKCPNAKGTKEMNGCPDSDGDGIADNVDKCPDVKGTKANKGCPEIKKEVKEVFKKALQGIQFESGKDVIKKSSNAILDNIAEIMKMNPAYKLNINGHTDSQGKPEANQVLSQQRADAVMKYLTDKGVEASRMVAIGHGDTTPVADNATAAGRAQNRRVEFIVEF